MTKVKLTSFTESSGRDKVRAKTVSKDSLGDRIKAYEARETERRFLQGVPLVLRLDGRGFSKFTKGMERPYDTAMATLMTETTKYLVEQLQANVGYTQSLFRPSTVSLQSNSLFYRLTTEVRQFMCTIINFEGVV